MIVLAVDNEQLKLRIDEIYKKDVYPYDITYMEDVIAFLSKQRENDGRIILITKDTLKGNLIKELYIKQIRIANDSIKIILLTENLTDQYKEFLFSNEIFNVIEGKEVDIISIVESINNDDKVVYKNSKSNVENQVNNKDYNGDIETTVIPKQFISIYGTSGSGKSYISGLLSKMLCKKLKIKISMLDMDIQNPSIDIYNNLDGAGNILSQIIEDIDKKREMNDIVDKYMHRDKINKNLWYMTNNTSIFDCQNKLNENYYKKIYYSIICKYDYVIVDLPSSPFMDIVRYTLNLSSTIFFVVNPNYISLRQGIKYLELMTKLWGVSKNNIFIIVNKKQKNSLDISQIETFLEGYKVVSMVDFEINTEGYINGAISEIYSKLDEKEIMKCLGVDYVNKSNQKNITRKLKSMFITKERKSIDDNKSIQKY
jgi:MinD-like ATPase involved in chromosome partitioning or flagellar assembly